MRPALFFDVDDTLYDLQWPFRMAVNDVFQGKYDDEIDRLFVRNRVRTDEKFGDYVTGRMTRDDYYCFRNQMSFRDCGIEITREKALEIFRVYRLYQKEIAMSDTIKKMLSALRDRGVMTGVISNGVSEAQWKKIETLRIPDYIEREHIIVSGDVGCSKPDPAIFQMAADRFGLQNEHLWYVGDTWLNDIKAAAQAGWHTIWINRRQFEAPAGETEADYVVKTEAELAALIETFEQFV